MDFILRLIIELYTILTQIGIKINPPNILFNSPKYIFEPKIVQEIHADTSFTKIERIYLLKAAEDWKRFSNNAIHFNLIFDLNLTDLSLMNDKSIIVRVHSSCQAIKESDERIKSNTLGLCFFNTDTVRTIYLVFDRLTNMNMLKSTTVHELGHYINLEHTDGHSIMNKCIMYDAVFLTYIDALEYCSKYNYIPKDLKYIKV